MRFLPTRLHGIIDYLWGAALLATPWLLGYADVAAATWTAVVFGLGAILYSAVTDYELGLVRLVPMPLHLRRAGRLALAVRLRRPGLPPASPVRPVLGRGEPRHPHRPAPALRPAPAGLTRPAWTADRRSRKQPEGSRSKALSP
jgi:hypothetical protein